MSVFSETYTLNYILSQLTSHIMPSSLWLGNASSGLRLTIDGASSVCGIASITSLLLLIHFVSRHPPSFMSDCRSVASLMACCSVGTDVRQS